MRNRWTPPNCVVFFLAVVAGVLLLLHGDAAFATADGLLENAAVNARVSASSQFSHEYQPQMAVEGCLPSGFQTGGNDWALHNARSGWFELQWAQPVEAAQIVYYARTASPLLECFKDYAVYLNGETKPTVRGELQQRRGPQAIALPNDLQMSGAFSSDGASMIMTMLASGATMKRPSDLAGDLLQHSIPAWIRVEIYNPVAMGEGRNNQMIKIASCNIFGSIFS